jgi:hypothetical protein
MDKLKAVLDFQICFINDLMQNSRFEVRKKPIQENISTFKQDVLDDLARVLRYATK